MAYHCEKYGSECDGCQECKVTVPTCPVCGEECEKLYRNHGTVIGCENCIEEVDSYGI